MNRQTNRSPDRLEMIVVALLTVTAFTLHAPAAPAGEKADATRLIAPGTGKWGRPGPFTVAELTAEPRDEKRGRTVPVRAYYPADLDTPAPVILVSHGLGGTRDTKRYLGTHWAGHGYVCVFLQHIGTDDSVWKGKWNKLKAMKDAVQNPKGAIDRPHDVSFIIDWLEGTTTGPLAGRLDLDRLGMAGHSYGSWTTLVVCGMRLVTPRGRAFDFSDDRIRAGLALSPSPGRQGDSDKVYGRIAVPIFHMTGTEDQSIVTTTTPEERTRPYKHIDGPPQYLLVLEGGDHMVFSGVRFRGDADERDPLYHSLIQAGSLAFWDAHLKGDREASAFLNDGGYAKAVGDHGEYEAKNADAE